jgi:hypothetical protein
MKRFSRQRSVLALALGGLVFTSLACDSMESDASKADRRVQKSVKESAEKRRTATTQSLAAAMADLNTAAKETGASPAGKIEAKSLLAEAQFEAGDRALRALNALDPDINRAFWEIGRIAAQIQRANDAGKALAATNPEATLKVIADKKTEMAALSAAAAKKASDLQGEIDKIKQQVTALTQQKDAAMAEAETAADKASKASDKDAVAILDAATESRRKGSNIGHDIDKQSAATLPLERDLAAEQANKATADQAMAALDEQAKVVQANWQTVSGQIGEQKALATKLGQELADKGKKLEDLYKRAAELRSQAIKEFKDSSENNKSASNDAQSLALQLGQWSNDDKFSKAPERKAWDQLRALYHLNVFKLLEAEAHTTLGTLYSNQAAQQAARAKLVASISKTLQEAGVAMPAALSAPDESKATEAAAAAYTTAGEKFIQVYEGSGTPKDVQQAARLFSIFTAYGQYLNGNKEKLGDAKKAYKNYQEALTDPKDDPMARWIPAEVRG